MSKIRNILSALRDSVDLFRSQLPGGRRAALARRLKRVHEQRDRLLISSAHSLDDLVWECLVEIVDLPAGGQLDVIERRLRDLRVCLTESEDERREQAGGARANEARRAYYAILAFFGGRDMILSHLSPDEVEELRRVREVYRRGAWHALRHSRETWSEAGVDDPAVALQLSRVGVYPGPLLTAPLSRDEIDAVTGLLGPTNAAKPLDLLDHDDGLQTIAWLMDQRFTDDANRHVSPCSCTSVSNAGLEVQKANSDNGPEVG